MSLYVPPTGSTDPKAPYLGKNVAAGQQGSKVPPGAVEYPQREIENFIVASQQTPTNSDLFQLTRGARSGLLNYFRDTGAQNALKITPSPTYLVLNEGNHFRIKTLFAPSGDSAIQVNALAAVPIRKSGGNALTGGEWAPGDIIDVEFDGAFFQLIGSQGASSVVATSDVIMNVPAQYSSIRAALLAASLLIVTPTTNIRIKLAPAYAEQITAQTQALLANHPYGQRITIEGSPLSGAFPTYAEVDGLSNSQMQSLLQARFNNFLLCVQSGGLELHTGFLSALSNIAIIGDGTANTGILVGNWSSAPGMGALGLSYVWVHNFGFDGIRAELLSSVQCYNVGVTYCGLQRGDASGIWSSRGSNVGCYAGNLTLMYNNVGATAFNNGLVTVDSSGGTIDVRRSRKDGLYTVQNGRINMLSATGVRISNNGTSGTGWGGDAFGDASILLPAQTVFAGNASGDLIAGANSRIYAVGSNAGTCSPAKNTTSSDGSRINV